MKTRMVLSLGLSALVMGGTMVGCTAGAGGIASASARNGAAADRGAADNAGKATKAIARRDGAGAVTFAEAAVQLAPRDADYRMLLGQGYLQAGRFASARDAFGDALQLSPDNGKAALNLALTQIATGDWATARKTLEAHAGQIPVSDLGLALALSGNTVDAVSLLTQAARSPEANAKIRQNLALSLALAGQWGAARAVAAADMSPADVDRRMEEWARFAQPQAASDQVAALLGVRSIQDSGQPVALALQATVPIAGPVQAAGSVAVASSITAPVAAAAPTPAPVEVAAAPAPAVTAPAAPIPPLLAKVVFAAPHEVAQALPTPMLRPQPGATKVALVGKSVATPIAKGVWYVQLGAFSNAGVAKDGWSRATRRLAMLSGREPTGMKFTSKAGSFYRLPVGGFSRADADRTCRSYRAKGGACFVRINGGDQMAQWLAKPVQVASR